MITVYASTTLTLVKEDSLHLEVDATQSAKYMTMSPHRARFDESSIPIITYLLMDKVVVVLHFNMLCPIM